MAASEILTPLTLEDTRILALETGPIRGHTMKVLLIDDAPGEAVVPALRAALAERLPGLARWKQRLVRAPGTPSGWAWQDDPEFHIEQHVRAASSDQPVDEQELRRIIAHLMTVPLDRSRPLWTLDVIPRLDDGRWALVWKVHHCLADGMTMMRAGSRLLWTEEPSSGPVKARSAKPSAPKKMVLGARLAKLISYRGLVLREFRRVWRLSPLAAEVGSERTVAFAHCTLDELRRIGKAVAQDVTVNDVLLAVATGALRRWMAGRPGSRARMKVQVPVSMHPHFGEDDPFGNRDSFLFVRLPLDEDDPVARVRAVSKATRLRKNRQDAHAIDALRDILSRTPAPVQAALKRLAQGPHEYSLNISNVPGPARSIHVLGHRVDAIYPIVEIAPHHALRVAADSLAGTLYIGLCADPQVIPDLDDLTADIRLAIDELHERLKLKTGSAPEGSAIRDSAGNREHLTDIHGGPGVIA